MRRVMLVLSDPFFRQEHLPLELWFDALLVGVPSTYAYNHAHTFI